MSSGAQGQLALEAFLPPEVEYEDGGVVLRSASHAVRLTLRELMRLTPEDYSRLLGVPPPSPRALFLWRSEVVQGFFERQPLRSVVVLRELRRVWEYAEPVILQNPRGGWEVVGVERVLTVFLAKTREGLPAIIIDRHGAVSVRRNTYAFEVADIGDAYLLLDKAPARVKRLVAQVVEERGLGGLLGTGGRTPKGGKGKGVEPGAREDEQAELLVREGIVLRPVPVLRSPEFLESIDWEAYVEDALCFGAEVDSRLLAVRACHALRGVEGRYLAHAILVGNSGSGKSQFYKVWGQHWDKITANTLIGYARGRDEVYPGVVDGAEEPIAVDQVESSDRANLARFLFDYMEDGTCKFASGGVLYEQRGLAPLVFIANPLATGGEKDFQRTLEVVSVNPALGGRMALIFYFTDLTQIRGSGAELTPEEEERWRRVKEFVRAVEDFCRPRLRSLYRDPKVLEWLSAPLPLYRERVLSVIDGLRDKNPALHEFFANHAAQAVSKLRAAALQAALLFSLKEIALGKLSVEELLSRAETWLRRLAELNAASIANIVEDFEGRAEQNLRARLAALPGYIRAVVAVSEAVRRAIFHEYAGRGQVPEHLSDITLNNMHIRLDGFGITYLSKALEKVRSRRRAMDELSAVSEALGLRYMLVEPGGLLRLTVRRWEPCPLIEVPEQLVKEVAEQLRRLHLLPAGPEQQREEEEKGEGPPAEGSAAEQGERERLQRQQPPQPQQPQPRSRPQRVIGEEEALRLELATVRVAELLKKERRVSREKLREALLAEGFTEEEFEVAVARLARRGKVAEVGGELVWT